MSTTASDTTSAPVHVICRRDDDDDPSREPFLEYRRRDGCVDGLCEEENCDYYVTSCLYFFFCHAVDSVLLHICCCVCFKSHLPLPEGLKPANKTQKVFASCMRVLCNLWASAMVLFIARKVFLRPDAVRPVLGACLVNQFELLQSPHPELRFNFTTHLLVENNHHYYAIGYDHPAAAVFYAGEKLGPVDDAIMPFKQEPLDSTVVDQAVVGRLRNTSRIVADTFSREKLNGRFEMVVRIRVTLSYMFWPFRGEYFTLYECQLSSPVPMVGQPGMSSPANCKTVKL